MKRKFTVADATIILLTLLIFYGLFRRFGSGLFDSVSGGISLTVVIGRNLILAALFAYLVINIITDIFMKKVFNLVSLAAVAFGLVANFIFKGPSFFVLCLAGAALGLVIFLLPFLADTKVGAYVKALTAIGALMGVNFMLWTTLFILILSELVRFIFIVRKKGVGAAFAKLRDLRDESTLFREEEDVLRGENLNVIPFGLTVLLSVLMTFYFISPTN
jgi:prepilin peptidase CpaA